MSEFEDATIDLMAGDDGKVHLHFPVPVQCARFDPDQADELAMKIMAVADMVRPPHERKTRQ